MELLVLSNRIPCLRSTLPASKHRMLCIKISPCPCAVRQGPWQDTDIFLSGSKAGEPGSKSGEVGLPQLFIMPPVLTSQKKVLTEEYDFLRPLHQHPCSNGQKGCVVCGAYPQAGSSARGLCEARAQHGKPGVRCAPLFRRWEWICKEPSGFVYCVTIGLICWNILYWFTGITMSVCESGFCLKWVLWCTIRTQSVVQSSFGLIILMPPNLVFDKLL